jgi:hypothetical protein
MLKFETAFGLLGLDGFVSLVLEIHAVNWGKRCTKILFLELDTKVVNCIKPDVKHTQPSVEFDSTNKYLIWFIKVHTLNTQVMK